MKKLLFTLAVAALAMTLPMSDAEAKRLGGGKSVGMQREMATPAPTRQAAPPAQQAAAQPQHAAPAPAATPAAQPKRSWLGPMAGLAAGLGLGALLAGTGLMDGMGGMLMDMLVIGLILFVAFKVIGLMMGRKKAATPSDPMQYAGVGGPSMNPVPESMPTSPMPTGGVAPAPVTAAATQPLDAPALPADFDKEAFLRVAKVNFIRLQAAFDAGNLDDLREFTAPELFAEIRIDLQERAGKTQQTDVVTLEAELLELVTESHQYVASVRFHGLIREEAQGGAEPINEIWHLAKPADGTRGWVVAGIQQHA